MPRTILVGLDGSPYSQRAVDLGLRLASQHKAMLVGLGIIDQATICKRELIPLGGDAFKDHNQDALLVEARRKADQLLGNFSLRCAEAQVSCKVLEEMGLPSTEIIEEAQRYDLILLGQQTYFHYPDQHWPDETLAQVVKQSPRPVLMVPDPLPEGNAIVVAYDGSLQAARALQAFEASNLWQGNDVHVVCIQETHGAAMRHAERALDYLAFHDVKAQRHALTTSETPAAVILQLAARIGAGVLVMGAYGRPTWREFFLGSTTRSILEESTLPVFLYH